MEWIGYISAVLMGLSLGLIGGGGSILTVPILVYFFKQDALIATTGSLFVVGMTALVGAAINIHRRQVDFKTGMTFAIPGIVGVFCARHIILPHIPDTIVISSHITLTKSALVLFCFATLMIFASRAMIRSAHSVAPIEQNKKPNSFLSIVIKGFLVGCTTGFVGAGGGFLIIPALVLLLHVPMRTAIGTSLVIISANSLFGFAVSPGHQTPDVKLLGTITILGVLGLLVGQRLSPFFPEKRLKQGFGYFVLGIGLFILLDEVIKIL